jgi:riboflavin synthase
VLKAKTENRKPNIKKQSMFTGIIEEIGTIKSVHRGSKSICLTIGAEKVLQDTKIGDSINTNGVCLTVVSFNKGVFSVDVMPETMRRTTLKELMSGSKVNLERALKLSDRLGGHLISGHIDGIGIIETVYEEDNAIWFKIKAESSLLKYIIEKGSVAIDGISLTVVNVDDRSFQVSVIPHTQGVTVILDRKTGDTVNLECDMIAKYVEKVTSHEKSQGNISMEFLAEQGFL